MMTVMRVKQEMMERKLASLEERLAKLEAEVKNLLEQVAGHLLDDVVGQKVEPPKDQEKVKTTKKK